MGALVDKHTHHRRRGVPPQRWPSLRTNYPDVFQDARYFEGDAFCQVAPNDISLGGMSEKTLTSSLSAVQSSSPAVEGEGRHAHTHSRQGTWCSAGAAAYGGRGSGLPRRAALALPPCAAEAVGFRVPAARRHRPSVNHLPSALCRGTHGGVARLGAVSECWEGSAGPPAVGRGAEIGAAAARCACLAPLRRGIGGFSGARGPATSHPAAPSARGCLLAVSSVMCGRLGLHEQVAGRRSPLERAQLATATSRFPFCDSDSKDTLNDGWSTFLPPLTATRCAPSPPLADCVITPGPHNERANPGFGEKDICGDCRARRRGRLPLLAVVAVPLTAGF
eukprot:m.155549 g.155549  ORF g.155549 m.155549 type:complete len:335 (-) comp11721_c0_seq18:2633-3637(-)